LRGGATGVAWPRQRLTQTARRCVVARNSFDLVGKNNNFDSGDTQGNVTLTWFIAMLFLPKISAKKKISLQVTKLLCLIYIGKDLMAGSFEMGK